MKLYVIDRHGEKVGLDITANSRRDLAIVIGSKRFTVDGTYYTVDDVYAESNNNDTAGGAVLGGLLGLLGGGVGLVIGGVVGGLIGSSRDQEEMKKIQHFNNSLG